MRDAALGAIVCRCKTFIPQCGNPIGFVWMFSYSI